jgi:hypothetical protein
MPSECTLKTLFHEAAVAALICSGAVPQDGHRETFAFEIRVSTFANGAHQSKEGMPAQDQRSYFARVDTVRQTELPHACSRDAPLMLMTHDAPNPQSIHHMQT